MQNKIFISAPLSVEWSTVANLATMIKNKGYKVFYWDRYAKYNPMELDTSDAVVFILPNNQMSCSYNELPIGLKTELARAFSLDKKIYVARASRFPTDSDPGFSIYNAQTNGKWIQGIDGTSNYMFAHFSALRAAHKIEVNSSYGFGTTNGATTGATYNASATTYNPNANPCAEIVLPKVYGAEPVLKSEADHAGAIQGILRLDERLLLMM